jgi:YfiR/HmsC-like
MARRTQPRLLLVPLCFVFGTLAAAASLEYEVKAAFLLNFATFTEWPPTAFESPSSPLRICILGVDPFDGSLLRTVKGESVAGHPLVVEHPSEEGIKRCHVLFIRRAVNPRGNDLNPGTTDAPVLVVSESETLWRAGSIINFAIDGGRVRFDVNQTASLRGGLRLSPKLLRVARTVR